MQPTTLSEATPSGDLPNHLQLPQTDGSIVENFQEHPQGNLLTGSLLPRLHELHPDGQFCVGQDSGIYFKNTKPPLAGCRAPDWFYVPGVPPMLDGQMRRSYVMWQEGVRPRVVIEYASGDGSEERDPTPQTGKFWIYENAIGAGYYAIFICATGELELYKANGSGYVQVQANANGRYPIEPLGIELGTWHGMYRGMDVPWLRVWDLQTGEMLPSEEERIEIERLRAEAERLRAEEAESLADDYRVLLAEQQEQSEAERKRAEEANRQKAEAERFADEANRQKAEAERFADEANRQKAEAERFADEANRLRLDAQRAAEDERRRAEAERLRFEKVAAQLRALGIDPEAA